MAVLRGGIWYQKKRDDQQHNRWDLAFLKFSPRVLDGVDDVGVKLEVPARAPVLAEKQKSLISDSEVTALAARNALQEQKTLTKVAEDFAKRGPRWSKVTAS
jgi:hypothetical protein